MKKSVLLASTAAAILTMTATALAQQDDSANWLRQRVAKHIAARIEGRLNVTPQQRQQAKLVLETEKPTILALTTRARQEREELAALPSFNESQVREIAQEYAATNADILVERAKISMQLRALLDNDQRRRLEKLRVRIGSHLEERFDLFSASI